MSKKLKRAPSGKRVAERDALVDAMLEVQQELGRLRQRVGKLGTVARLKQRIGELTQMNRRLVDEKRSAWGLNDKRPQTTAPLPPHPLEASLSHDSQVREGWPTASGWPPTGKPAPPAAPRIIPRRLARALEVRPPYPDMLELPKRFRGSPDAASLTGSAYDISVADDDG